MASFEEMEDRAPAGRFHRVSRDRTETPPPSDHRSYNRPASSDGEWHPLIDPEEVLAGIWRSKTIIVLTTLIGLALGIMIALATPKLYYSTAEILIDPRELKLSNTDIRQSDLPYSATLALIENQVRIITSDTVVRRVVDRLSLQRDPEFNGDLAGGAGEVIRIVGALMGRDTSDATGSKLTETIENLYERLHVERSGKTFVVTITIGSIDAEKAALIANTFSDVFLDTAGSLQIDTATRANTEVSSRLDELKLAVEDAEKKVEEYKSANGIVDARGRLITDEELLRVNDSLSAAKARTIELNAKASTLRELDITSVIEGGLPEQVTSTGLISLRGQYAAAKQGADQLSVSLGTRHPKLREAKARVESARVGIRQELQRIASAAQVELRRAVKQEQELAARLAQLKARQGALSGDLIELRELERDAASKRSVYENYLLRAREIGQQAGLNTSNFNVISMAQPAQRPTGMRRSVIALLGAMMGFAAGLVIGALRGAWAGIRNSQDHRHRLLQNAHRPRQTRDVGEDEGYWPDDDGGAPRRSRSRLSERLARRRAAVPEQVHSDEHRHEASPGMAPVGHAPPASAPQLYQAPVPQPTYVAYPAYAPSPYPQTYPWMQMPAVPSHPYPNPVQPPMQPAPAAAPAPAETGHDQKLRRDENDLNYRAEPATTARAAPGADMSDIRERLRNFRNKVDSLSSERRR